MTAPNNQVPQGGTGKFQIVPGPNSPAGAKFPAGTTYAMSSSDAQATLAQDPSDPTGSTFILTDAAGDPATSDNLAGAAQIPGTPAPPPIATPILAVAIVQPSAPVPTDAVVVQVA